MNMWCNTRQYQRAHLKPIFNRFFVAVLLATALTGAAAPALAQGSGSAEPALTEEQAVSQALARRALTNLWEARASTDEAEALAEGVWPNPQVGYNREQSFEGSQTVAEDVVFIEQTLALSGRRGLVVKASRTRAQATRLEARADALRIATQVRRAFYGTLSLERRLQARAEWLEQMERVEDAMLQRVEAGESAPYELERLRREIADVEAAESTDQAELVRQRARLAGLLGQPASQERLAVTGELVPRDLPDETAVRAAVAERPEVVAAQKRAAAAELDVEAASRWWVPEPTLTGGYKGASVADERFHGFVAGIALDVPLFDQRQGQRLEAEAALVRTRSRQELIEQRLSAELVGLARQARTLGEAAEAYRSAGVERAERVLEVAQQAYDADEIGILELIDAYRGAVDSQLRLIELQSQARQRQIELQQSLEELQQQPSSSPSE